MDDRYQKIKEVVEKELACSAHDMDHIIRVYDLCVHLAEDEDIDLDVLLSAALLHDIARVKEDQDYSGNTDHAVLSAIMAVPILKNLGYSEERVEHIKHCILSHRFRGEIKPKTLEAMILFDADKLDAIGAIGIARSFVWVGRNNAKIYSNVEIQEYIKENLGGRINGRIRDKTKHSPQIEFETKLKHIPDQLYTLKAKQIAYDRMNYMREFFYRLEKEIQGES